MGGDYEPDVLKEMVRRGKIGGILFRPVKPCEDVKADYAPLDAVAKVPLLKAANLEEGGSGGMSDGTLFGWPMLSAASNDASIVEKFGKACAVEGRRAGINWTFSPVSDLDINYLNPITNVRTFGSDPEKVIRFTEPTSPPFRAWAWRPAPNTIPAALEALKGQFPAEYAKYHDAYAFASGDAALAERVRLINPLSFIGTGERSSQAAHYRIRVGASDADAALIVSMTLALKLANANCGTVDYALVWGLPHCEADYPGEVCDWIDGICEQHKKFME